MVYSHVSTHKYRTRSMINKRRISVEKIIFDQALYVDYGSNYDHDG